MRGSQNRIKLRAENPNPHSSQLLLFLAGHMELTFTEYSEPGGC